LYKIWKRLGLQKTSDSVAFKALIITQRNCLSHKCCQIINFCVACAFRDNYDE